nr:MAG TPA: hypothetical protein [Caudoviricetes sp.]
MPHGYTVAPTRSEPEERTRNEKKVFIYDKS